ncbi:MAG TPA: hypothetical protein VG053_07165 [Solirubrobacteraceae bacterium]|jgi:hypothetical protein|nr:hypothetical protein [Solirubrobacteraceae bacterium]
MARALIRYSFSDESSNQSGNEVVKRLKYDAGFEKHGRTACLEADAPIADIVIALKRALDLAERPLAGSLDHMWIYIDQSGGKSLD